MSPTTKAYLAPFCTQTRTQAAGAIPPSVCLAPHMASLTFPVKVWVLPAATPGTTANPVLSTTVTIHTCNIRKRDINNPPVFRSCDWEGLSDRPLSHPSFQEGRSVARGARRGLFNTAHFEAAYAL